ncbi:MAG: slipin family protein, partial [Terriglobia bacterium]
RQAEAERERRAKIINADGEFQAAEKLKAAAQVMEEEPISVTLRYLQTLQQIGVEKNTTIIFPLPLDLLAGWIASAGGTRLAGLKPQTEAPGAPSPDGEKKM